MRRWPPNWQLAWTHWRPAAVAGAPRVAQPPLPPLRVAGAAEAPVRPHGSMPSGQAPRTTALAGEAPGAASEQPALPLPRVGDAGRAGRTPRRPPGGPGLPRAGRGRAAARRPTGGTAAAARCERPNPWGRPAAALASAASAPRHGRGGCWGGPAARRRPAQRQRQRWPRMPQVQAWGPWALFSPRRQPSSFGAGRAMPLLPGPGVPGAPCR
mmetsp:Transcript_16357/g.51386  ORF Transcript_16357/g.51386 Transcript_16357/m.51386 type:complete len:212 (-) Transcript_16357:563-1198(-)